MTKASIAVIWERFGEYHHARLERAAQKLSIKGIEIVAHDRTYAWAKAEKRDGYTVETLNQNDKIKGRELRRRIDNALSRISPQAIASPGWSSSYELYAIDWARRNNRPAIIMSDSNKFDAKRHTAKEYVKRAVISHTSAGFAAGTTAREYLEALGMPRNKIALGYDVVDNNHFTLREAETQPDRHGFLCVARFVKKKNLPVLLQAYARYLKAQNTGAPWPLLLVGDGPEAEELQRQAYTLNITPHVHFAGFCNYDALPALYQASGAFVLPSAVEQWGLVVNEAMAASLPVIVSNKAGSATDLVVNGRNGFSFSPKDIQGLADIMVRIAVDPTQAKKMGAESRKIILNWGLDRFSDGLSEAVDFALNDPLPHTSPLNRLIFSTLIKTAQ